MHVTLGLEIDSDVQAYSALLADIAAIAPSAGGLLYGASTSGYAFVAGGSTSHVMFGGGTTGGAPTFGPPGVVMQRVYTEFATPTSSTGTIPNDSTTPQITEGVEFMTRSISLLGSTSLIRVYAKLYYYDAGSGAIAALFQDATANALAVDHKINSTVNFMQYFLIDYVLQGASTTGTTFRIRAGQVSGTGAVNALTSTGMLGNNLRSYMIVEEFRLAS
jgi:hypothetical protein